MRRFVLLALLVAAGLTIFELWRWSVGDDPREALSTREQDARGEPAALEPSTPSTVASNAAPEYALMSELARSDREQVERAPNIATANAAHAAEHAVELAGVIVDAAGTPVANAQIALSTPARSDFPKLASLAGAERPRVYAHATSDARGGFRFFVSGDRAFDLGAVSGEHGVALMRGLLPSTGHVVRLRPAASLAGRVASSDGLPVEGARVRVCALGGAGEAAVELASTLTRDDGSFDVTELAPSSVRVQVDHPRFYRTLRTITLDVGEACKLAIELDPGDAIGGTVVDAADDTPIAGATIEIAGGESQPASSGPKGEFQLRGPPGAQSPDHRGATELLVRAPGFRAQRLPLIEVRQLGRVALSRGRRVIARVVDADRRPVPGAAVALVDLEGPPSSARTLEVFREGDLELREAFEFPPGGIYRPSPRIDVLPAWTETDERGAFELEGANPRGGFAVVVRAPGRGYTLREIALAPEKSTRSNRVATARARSMNGEAGVERTLGSGPAVFSAGESEGESAPVPTTPWSLDDIVVEDPVEIAGVVVDEEGQPLASALVEIDSRAGTARTPRVELGVEELAREALTDEQGSFRFARVPPGARRVSASHQEDLVGRRTPGKADPSTLSLTLGPGEKRTDLRLVVPRCRPIAGVVVDPWGNPLPGIVVRHQGGTLTTDAHGRFEVAAFGREPRAVTASLASEYSLGTQTCRFADTTVSDVIPGAQRVVIQMRRSLPLGGRLIEDGKAFRGAVIAQDARGVRIDIAFADEDGRFEVRAPEGEAVELVVLGTALDGGSRRMRGESRPLVRLSRQEPGRTDLVVDVPRH